MRAIVEISLILYKFFDIDYSLFRENRKKVLVRHASCDTSIHAAYKISCLYDDIIW